MRREAQRYASALLFLAPLLGARAEAQAPSPPTASAGESEKVDYSWKIRPLNDEPMELETYRGKVLLINAWASWCTPCVREMSSIERLTVALDDTDITILLIAVEREQSVRNHLRRYPTTLPIFLEEERFPAAFGLHGIPMSWIVDREGHIVARHFGAAEWDDPKVETWLRELAR